MANKQFTPNYLGVTIGKRLNFKKHIEGSATKALLIAATISRIIPNIAGPRQGWCRLISRVFSKKGRSLNSIELRPNGLSILYSALVFSSPRFMLPLKISTYTTNSKRKFCLRKKSTIIRFQVKGQSIDPCRQSSIYADWYLGRTLFYQRSSSFIELGLACRVIKFRQYKKLKAVKCVFEIYLRFQEHICVEEAKLPRITSDLASPEAVLPARISSPVAESQFISGLCQKPRKGICMIKD